MGTNYYAKIIPKKERLTTLRKFIRDNYISKKTMLDSITASEPDLVLSDIENFIYEYRKLLEANIVMIHLGKNSSGWQFNWAWNTEYYDANFESVKKFLYRDDVVIYNEYHEVFTADEFLDEIKTKIFPADNLWTSKSYHEERKGTEEYRTYTRYFSGNELISDDGLRFSRDVNFS